MKDYVRLSPIDLENRINATKAYIHRQQKREEESKDAEIDLCHLEREQEFRHTGAAIHVEYIKAFHKERNKARREEEEVLQEAFRGETNYDA
jgi:hypothetical protein